MFHTLFPRDVFAELDRLQREMRESFDLSPSIRGLGRGGFPALNVGSTPQSVEIFLDRGVLTIAGERRPDLPVEDGGKAAVHINERFSGRFRRVVSLSDDVDPNAVSADYRDGVLHISAKRREAARPRRITVQ